MRSFRLLTQTLILLATCSNLVAFSPRSGGDTAPQEGTTGAPTGTLGVSAVARGPFRNDLPNGIANSTDERVVRVAAGGIFYAQVRYRDPDGITAVELRLVNSSPTGLAGALNPEQGGFRIIDAAVRNCNLSGGSTTVTCLFMIQVAEDAVNIDLMLGAEDEFAYVFRTYVSDRLGNRSEESIRGYVVITGSEDAASSRTP